MNGCPTGDREAIFMYFGQPHGPEPRGVRTISVALPLSRSEGEERGRLPPEAESSTFLRAEHSLWQCQHCQAALRAAVPKRSKAWFRSRRNGEPPVVLFGRHLRIPKPRGPWPKALNG